MPYFGCICALESKSFQNIFDVWFKFNSFFWFFCWEKPSNRSNQMVLSNHNSTPVIACKAKFMICYLGYWLLFTLLVVIKNLPPFLSNPAWGASCSCPVGGILTVAFWHGIPQGPVLPLSHRPASSPFLSNRSWREHHPNPSSKERGRPTEPFDLETGFAELFPDAHAGSVRAKFPHFQEAMLDVSMSVGSLSLLLLKRRTYSFCLAASMYACQLMRSYHWLDGWLLPAKLINRRSVSPIELKL